MSASVPVSLQEFTLLGARLPDEQFIERWVVDAKGGEPDPTTLKTPLILSFDADSSKALRMPARLAQALAETCSTEQFTLVPVKLAAVELAKFMAAS